MMSNGLKKQMPLVDILLSTYNGEAYLEEQLQSLLYQTHENWRLIVRDDGSSDNTVEIIKTFLHKYPHRIRYIDDGEKRLGACHSFIKLLGMSEAGYIMFCDQDDVWLNGKIELTLQKLLEEEQKYGKQPILVHTDLTVVDRHLEVISDSFWLYQKLSPYDKSLNKLLVQNNVTGCTMMVNGVMRTFAVKAPKDVIMHDWWIALIAAAFGRIEHLDKTMIQYRQHGKNDTGAKKYSFNFFVSRVMNLKTSLKSIRKTIYQSRAFLSAFESMFAQDQKEVVSQYSTLVKRSPLERYFLCNKYGYRKYGFLRNLGFILLLCFIGSDE